MPTGTAPNDKTHERADIGEGANALAGPGGAAKEGLAGPTVARIGGLGLCGLMVVLSSAISFRFGEGLGGGFGEPLALALAFLAADGFKLIAPTLALALLRKGRATAWFAAVLVGFLGAACLAASVLATLGVAGGFAVAPDGESATGAVAALSKALGLDAAVMGVALPVVLALLIESGSIVIALFAAFWLARGGAEPVSQAVLEFAEEQAAVAAPQQISEPQVSDPPVSEPQVSAPPSKTPPKTPSTEAPDPISAAAAQAPSAISPAPETLDRTPEPAERDPEEEADQTRRKTRRRGWSMFRKKPRTRAYGDGTAAPLDEPQPGAATSEKEERQPGVHHGRALHGRVKDMTERLEREARERRERQTGGRPDRKDSA